VRLSELALRHRHARTSRFVYRNYPHLDLSHNKLLLNIDAVVAKMAIAVDAGMATADTTAPFRFMDLPGELRNKVYTLLLCSFEPAPARIRKLPDRLFSDDSRTSDFVSASQSNDPAILRVNSRVHREAYDVMVKTNRFLRISFPDGLYQLKMIAGSMVPIVASAQRAVQFNE
jgi:hypothetical protein